MLFPVIGRLGWQFDQVRAFERTVILRAGMAVSVG
jgi:hypothetical protein